MNRRSFLHRSTLAVTAVVIAPSAVRAAVAPSPMFARHFPAQLVSVPPTPLPPGKRSPFGWQTAAVGETPLVFAWKDLPTDVTPTHLRVTVGLDIRDEKLIEAYLPKSGRVVGTFDIRFGCIFQVFAIPLTAADVADLRREGLALRRTKGADLRILTTGDGLPPALQPHLLVPGRADPTAEFFARLDTLACVQAFSWQEGCVLDGLLDLAALPAHAHLREAARRQLARLHCRR